MGSGRAGEGEHTLVCGKAHFWAHWTALGFFTLSLIFFRASTQENHVGILVLFFIYLLKEF